MDKDRILGVLTSVASLIGLASYGWILFFSKWSVLALELTCFIIAVLVLGIIAWIGYTFAKTVPPKPIREDEIDHESSRDASHLDEKNVTGDGTS